MDNLHLVSKYAICYGIFFLLTYVSKLNEGNRLFTQNGPVRQPGILLGFQLAGILWLGIIPYFILHNRLPETIGGTGFPGPLKLSCVALLIAVAFSCAIKEGSKTRPETSFGNGQVPFTTRFIYRYIPYRIAFLFCYESFLRGYLLNDSISHYGPVIAVILNIFLYTLLHVFNGRKEIIACIFFGAVLCLVCMWVSAAWPAIIIHTVFTITYELRLIKKFTGTFKKTLYESICYRLFGLYRK